MDKESVCEAFERGLDLEAEGMEFYLKAAKATSNKQGRDMFNHLADEEKVHYDNIASLYEKLYNKQYCLYKEKSGERADSGVFEEKVSGGIISEKSDALDALNIAIKAEENSIELYGRLAKDAPDEEARIFFSHLVEEEQKHRQILEAEVEFITETGEFTDFKTVTM